MNLTTVEISASGTRITLDPSQGEIILNPDGEAFWATSDGVRSLPSPNAYAASKAGLALVGAFDCHARLQDLVEVAETTGYPVAILYPMAIQGVGLLWKSNREGALYLTLEGEPVATFSLCERCQREIRRRVKSLLKKLPTLPA